jgi:hypothetical protein
MVKVGSVFKKASSIFRFCMHSKTERKWIHEVSQDLCLTENVDVDTITVMVVQWDGEI